MNNLVLFAAATILTGIFHYLGFSASEEYFLFERKYAKGFFFVMLAVALFLAYLSFVEYSVGVGG